MSNSSKGGAYQNAHGEWHVYTKAETMTTRPKTVTFKEPTAQELAAMRKGEPIGYSTEHHTAEQVLAAMLDAVGDDLLLNGSCLHLDGFDAYDEALNPEYVPKYLPNKELNPKYKGAPKFLHDISAAKLMMFMQGEGKDRVAFVRNYSVGQFKWKKGKKVKAPKHETTQLGGLSIK